MPAALNDAEIEERFFVLGTQSIIATLGQFIYKSIPVTVHFNAGRDFFLTTLLEARPESLIFDLSGDAQANKRLLQAAACTFVTSVNGIRVQFSTSGGVRKIWWDDAEAFVVTLPTRVIRLQRRDAYRMIMPIVKFVSARLQFELDGVPHDKICPIHDLSVSGLGLTFPRQCDLEPGQKLERVTFALPERREIDCAGVICHNTEIAVGSENQSSRIGLAFENLDRSMEIAIQRYIISVEQIRRALAAESI